MLFLDSTAVAQGAPPFLLSGRELLRSGGCLEVGESLSPLMTIRIGPHLTSQMLEAYLEVRTEWLRRGEPHLSLYDLRAMPIAVAPFRQRFIDWLREHERDLRRWVIGSAYVAQSPEGHMLTSLVRHGAAVQTPFVITSTLSAAAEWAAERFHERGMHEAELRVRAHYGLLAG